MRFGLLLLVVTTIAISACVQPTSPETGGGDSGYSTAEFAQCLTSKGAKVYTAWWCSHCDEQKALFGDAWEQLVSVECSPSGSKEFTPACLAAGIRGVPTWEFKDGQRLEGKASLSQLVQWSGCTVSRPPSDVQFAAPAALPPATVGVPYAYFFCWPARTGTSDLCGPSSLNPVANPTGGNPPYHFQLESGTGFPPSGLSLSLNGLLAGTPKAAGQRTFTVCAVDLSANQACQTTSLKVVAAVNLTTRQVSPGREALTRDPGPLTDWDCRTVEGAWTCTAAHPRGTVVTLTAPSSAGYAFKGWSGACSGTGTCVVTMDSEKTVTATFDWVAEKAALVYRWAGTGRGSLTSDPGLQSKCETVTGEVNYQCTVAIGRGAVVNFSAQPEAGSRFTGWSGVCSGTGECTVTMDSDKVLTARFERTGSTPTAPAYATPVAPTYTSTPTPTPAATSSESPDVSIQSVSCTVRDRTSQGAIYSYTLDARGSTSGPTGTQVSPFYAGSTVGGYTVSCDAWGSNCQRDTGEPSSTTWHYTEGIGTSYMENLITSRACSSGRSCVDAQASFTCSSS